MPRYKELLSSLTFNPASELTKITYSQQQLLDMYISSLIVSIVLAFSASNSALGINCRGSAICDNDSEAANLQTLRDRLDNTVGSTDRVFPKDNVYQNGVYI
jgi:hypothetical protein